MTGTEITANQVAITASTAQSTKSEIELWQTSPDTILFHRIEDNQLEVLTNITRPVALTLATTALGAFLGLIPSVFDVFGKIGAEKIISYFDVSILLIWAVCCVTAIIEGIYAWRGQKLARDTIQKIRARTANPI